MQQFNIEKLFFNQTCILAVFKDETSKVSDFFSNLYLRSTTQGSITQRFDQKINYNYIT